MKDTSVYKYTILVIAYATNKEIAKLGLFIPTSNYQMI